MIITSVCDACRVALDGETTSVQMNTGEIVATSSGGVSLRNTRAPTAVNLCERCIAPLRRALAQVLSQRGASAHAES